MNEAAKRLRQLNRDALIGWDSRVLDSLNNALDVALAAERRATVERIRANVDALPYWDKRSVPGGLHVNRNAVRAILDEEAAR